MKTRTGLTLQRFTELLDSNGHDLQTWPEPESSDGGRLLASSSEARVALEQARELAVLLDGVHPPEPSAHLTARVLEIPIRHPRNEARSWWPFATILRPVMGLAAAAVLGILSGALLPPTSDELASSGASPAGEELPSSDWEEMSELALGTQLDLEPW